MKILPLTVIHDIWIHTHTHTYIFIYTYSYYSNMSVYIYIYIYKYIYIHTMYMYLFKKNSTFADDFPIPQKYKRRLPRLLPNRGEGPLLRRALGCDRCLAVQVGGGSATGGVRIAIIEHGGLIVTNFHYNPIIIQLIVINIIIPFSESSHFYSDYSAFESYSNP